MPFTKSFNGLEMKRSLIPTVILVLGRVQPGWKVANKIDLRMDEEETIPSMSPFSTAIMFSPSCFILDA